MQDLSQDEGMERRMVHRLLMHWREAHESDEIPAFGDVLNRDLGDISPCIYVLEIKNDGDEPIFERIGDGFANEGTVALVDQPVSAVSENTLLGQAVKYYRRVQDRQIPITLGGEFTHLDGNVILYRSIIMPARGDEQEDRYMIGAANCKIKDAPAKE